MEAGRSLGGWAGLQGMVISWLRGLEAGRSLESPVSLEHLLRARP